MSMSDTTSNSANLHLYYEKKLLSVLQPRLVLYPLGKKQKLPKGLGKQVKWLRYSRIAGSTSTLTEGVAPSEISFTTANVTANVAQYGQFVKVSDLLSDTAIDPVMESLSELFGRAAADSVEQLIIAELDSGAAIQRVNDRANDDAIQSTDILNHKEIIEAMQSQEAAFIPPHESGQRVCVLHPLCKYDILADTQAGSWLDINKYVVGAQSKLMNGEFGNLYGAKLLISDKMTSITGALTSVRRNYVIGEEAFGVVELGGSSIQMIMKDNESGGVSNPLNQFATVGYKIHGFAAKYLDASSKRVIQIRSASSLS